MGLRLRLAMSESKSGKERYRIGAVVVLKMACHLAGQAEFAPLMRVTKKTKSAGFPLHPKYSISLY
jgi:hypothetical protein